MTAFEDTAKRLNKMGAGQRAWFSLCPSLELDKPLLLLRFLREDPDSTEILSAQKSLTNEGFILGMMMLNPDGRIQLMAPGLTYDHLVNLSKWVHTNVGEYSSLSRLKHCVLKARLFET